MATTGVMRPGHVQVRVLDMDESVKFYRDVLGLVQTGADASGRVYFKAWDEHDHNSVILRQAESAGMDFIGFKVLDAATLEKLEANLKAYGVATERIPAGDLLETGERVRFTIPTGHVMELYAEKTCVGPGRLSPSTAWPRCVSTTACSTGRTSTACSSSSPKCWASTWSKRC
jgi:catechol 2,3-dioxygenase